jgi:hypothetical protein
VVCVVICSDDEMRTRWYFTVLLKTEYVEDCSRGWSDCDERERVWPS